MSSAKNKLLGIILIIVGAFPLLMKLTSFSEMVKQYSWFSYIVAGEPVYQGILIVIGILLVIEFKAKNQPYAYPPRR